MRSFSPISSPSTFKSRPGRVQPRIDGSTSLPANIAFILATVEKPNVRSARSATPCTTSIAAVGESQVRSDGPSFVAGNELDDGSGAGELPGRLRVVFQEHLHDGQNGPKADSRHQEILVRRHYTSSSQSSSASKSRPRISRTFSTMPSVSIL